jgi:Rrf2 family protein
MKITSQEEYGIRILLRIANTDSPEGMTIPCLSEAEGLSQHYVAKLCRLLRMNGLIRSTRGKEGGYFLAKAPDETPVNEVLAILGGKLFSQEFCQNHSGTLEACNHSCACSVRSIWQLVQESVDQVLNQYTLQDLIDWENGKVKNQYPGTKISSEVNLE